MKNLIPASVIFICSLLSSFSQEPNPDFSPIADSVFEDITLLLGRDLYLTGETIRLSAQITMNKYNDHHTFSKVLYVELMSSKGRSFAKTKFTINNDMANGSLLIPDDLPSDVYFLRAYTRILANYPVESFFTYPLTLVNPQMPFKTDKEENVNEVKFISFKSEGYSSDKTQVGFQINPKLNRQVKEVFLVNENNNDQTKIKYFNNGLGKFEIIQSDTINYSFKLLLTDGDSLLQILPPHETSGISISAVPNKNELTVYIFNTEANVKPEKLNLNIYSNYGIEIYSAQIIVSTGEIIQMIPLKSLSEGINYISLSDEQGSVKSLQAFFKPSSPNRKVKINLDKEVIAPRELVEFTYESSSENLSKANFQVTVIKKGLSSSAKTLPLSVIENPQLLTSFMKNPGNFYEDLNEQIDILLQFYSQSLLNIETENLYFKDHDFYLNYLPDTRDVSLTGIVVDPNSNLPVENAEVVLSVISDQPQVHFNRSKQNGFFIFPLSSNQHVMNLFVGAKSTNRLPLQVKINNDFVPEFPALFSSTPIFDDYTKNLLDELIRNYQLESHFTIVDSNNREKLQSDPFLFGEEMILIDLDDYIELSSMEEIFKEIVPFAALKKENDNYYFRIMDPEQKLFYEDPLILLDNIPVNDINQIADFHPKSIDQIGVINEMYLLGDYTLWGVIYITTKTGNFAGYKFPQESVFMEYQSVSKQPDFYHKQYLNNNQYKSRIPDFRNILYWNPSASIINAERPLSFYTSDDCSEYDIIIQGIDDHGNLYYGQAGFKVSRK